MCVNTTGECHDGMKVRLIDRRMDYSEPALIASVASTLEKCRDGNFFDYYAYNHGVCYDNEDGNSFVPLIYGDDFDCEFTGMFMLCLTLLRN